MNENDLHSEAERALLGAILIEGSCYNVIPEIETTPDDFLIDFHHDIYMVMMLCDLPNIVTVPHKLWEQRKLAGKELAYIWNLIADCPNSLDYESYAHVVKDYSKSRMGIRKPLFKGTV
jgi:replicative DNA helicase